MQPRRGRTGAFAGILALIVWSCSSTSHDFGGRVQPGAAGDGGEPTIIGAGGNDATVNGGAAADSADATVSDAGGGSQSDGLRVVGTTPANTEVGVERDAVVTVTFSAAIDPGSVTAETFQVTGPAGPVDGKLAVKGATVTFSPSAAWPLLRHQ